VKALWLGLNWVDILNWLRALRWRILCAVSICV
jgi:hypothetical protein